MNIVDGVNNKFFLKQKQLLQDHSVITLITLHLFCFPLNEANKYISVIPVHASLSFAFLLIKSIQCNDHVKILSSVFRLWLVWSDNCFSYAPIISVIKLRRYYLLAWFLSNWIAFIIKKLFNDWMGSSYTNLPCCDLGTLTGFQVGIKLLIHTKYASLSVCMYVMYACYACMSASNFHDPLFYLYFNPSYVDVPCR